MTDTKSKRDQDLKMISINISYYRHLKGLTQEDLAEKAGISRTHLSTIESRNLPTQMSLTTLMDIADALEIPVQLLLDFDKAKYMK